MSNNWINKYAISSDAYDGKVNKNESIKNIYWGEVISIEDDTEGGRVKVRLPDLDSKILNENLPWSYPMLPKFFHLYPKVGEVVRVFIEDVRYPQRSRYWMGSVISQLTKTSFDPLYTALSTTNVGYVKPDKAHTEYPDAKGVYPTREDVAILGRENTDIILRLREIELRAGKHVHRNNLELNKKNPASIKLSFDLTGDTTISSSVVMGDRIALISHEGKPKFKASELDAQDRDKVFSEGHPMVRGDVMAEALEIMRKAIIQHIHGYPKLPADKSSIINDLEKIDFNQILQKNIVIN